MTICDNCGVELESNLKICPLCNLPVGSVKESTPVKNQGNKQTSFESRVMNQPQRKAAWELVSVILILIIVITSIINFVVNGSISWSEYIVGTCLVLFSYITCFAFLNRSREIQVLAVVVSSSTLVFLLDLITGKPFWARQLGIPILFFLNLIIIGLLEIIKLSKDRGVNLIAYFFISAAFLCIGIEATIDNYLDTHTKLVWSLIVSACVVPIATILLFIHYRLRRGRDLKKTFHI